MFRTLIVSAWMLPSVLLAKDLPQAGSILDRCIQVTGGQALHATKHTLIRKGKVEIAPMGMKGRFTQYQAEPNLNRLESGLLFGRIESGFDGKTAWEYSPFQGFQAKTGEDAEAAEQEACFPIRDWRVLYEKAQVLGTETIEGEPCYKLQLTPRKGVSSMAYYSLKTGLLVKGQTKVKGPAGDLPKETTFRDYKRVDGVMIPHTVVEAWAGLTMTWACTSVEWNHPIPASQFEPPVRANQPAGPEVKEWIKANLIPLKSCEAGHGFTDLQPLKALVGKARIVSLGEATHGTREFFQMKHRVLEFLVEEMGFDLFAMEASMPEAEAVNKYVLEGRGDATKALAGLGFPVWNTEEVLDMIHWMRRYNEDPRHARKLKFCGFDMQNPRVALDRVAAFLKTLDPEGARLVDEKLMPILAIDPNTSPAILKEQLRLWQEAAQGLLARFDASREAWIGKSSKRAFEMARQDARILTQRAEQLVLDSPDDLAARDRSMAENVQWILAQAGPGAKAVLWAHNSHVQVDSLDILGGMGAHLRKTFGQDMVAFGFAFHQGGFKAYNSNTKVRNYVFEVQSDPRATLDAALASAGVPLFALDLRKVPADGPVQAWFRAPQTSRWIGSEFNEAMPEVSLKTTPFTQAFDAMLFVEKTTHAIPCQGPK